MRWHYRHTTILLCTVAFFATMTARLVISPVVPDIANVFSVSNGMIGLALSLMWAAYALSQFPSGVLADRYGERMVILTALMGTVLTSTLLSISPSFGFFAVTVVLLGAVAGLHYSVATTLLTREFRNTGRAIGIHVAGGPLAGLTAPVAAAAVATLFGWRAAIAIGAVVALPTFLAFSRFIRPTEPRLADEPLQDRFEVDVLVSLLSRPPIVYMLVLALIGAFAWQATASFLPAFLEGRGFSRQTAGILFSVYFLVHGASQPVIGTISDRVERDLLVSGVLSAGLLGYGLLVVTEGFFPVLLGVISVGVAMSWGAPLQSRFMDVLSDAERGTGFGLIRTVYMTLGASGSVVIGATADFVGWTASFGLLAVMMVIGIGVISLNHLARLGY